MKKHLAILHCCGCGKLVTPRLTSGKEVYPHRDDLHDLPFWKCDACGNYVGCHHKTKDRTRPLGSIPTPEIRESRKKIHALLDPMWKLHGFSRGKIYAELEKLIGREYHTAEVNTAQDAAVIIQKLVEMNGSTK